MDSATQSIFICYRRAETADNADIIYDFLKRKFSEETLFRDIDSIPRGVNFEKYVEQALCGCDVVIVLIGKEWVDITDEDGKPRLHQQGDHVRSEVAAALKKEPPYVMPVPYEGQKCPPQWICQKTCVNCHPRMV